MQFSNTGYKRSAHASKKGGFISVLGTRHQHRTATQQLIYKHGYLRRKEELEDAEQALGVRPGGE